MCTSKRYSSNGKCYGVTLSGLLLQHLVLTNSTKRRVNSKRPYTAGTIHSDSEASVATNFILVRQSYEHRNCVCERLRLEAMTWVSRGGGGGHAPPDFFLKTCALWWLLAHSGAGLSVF